MASSPQHEPTMEEILASIRKIISEDSAEAAPAAPAAAAPSQPEPAPEPEETPSPAAAALEEDVLELTEELKEPEPAPTPAPEPVAAAPVPAAEDVEFKTIETPAPITGSDIFSDKTRQAIDDAFSKLDSEEEVAAQPAPSPMASTFRSTNVDGDSVEAVFERAVRDAVGPHIDQWMSNQKDDLLAAMKPLIREWMDEHFPAILEGAVRDEVARAVKARAAKR
jgi:cell pole-organizing protein PopZ